MKKLIRRRIGMHVLLGVTFWMDLAMAYGWWPFRYAYAELPLTEIARVLVEGDNAESGVPPED